MSATTQASPATSRRRPDLARYTQQLGLIGVIVVLALIFQSRDGAFLSHGNIIELVRSGTLYFIVASATTLILVAGGLDFSIGAIFALCTVAAGWMMTHGVAWPLAILLGIGLGAVLGLVNAAAAIYLKIPPLIATLAMSFVASGLAFIISGGLDIFGFPDAFLTFGTATFLGIPVLIYYAAIIGLVFHVLLERTVFGYNTRSIGGNRAAAVANGIRVARMDFWLYAISGGVAAFAGILGAARLSTASPTAGGTAFTFQVVTAVIIGGTSLFGGTGTIAGAALGSLLFAEINNGLQVIDINPLYQSLIIGFILAFAVAIDQFRRGRRFK